ncbi:FAD-dependent oxidoreductase [Agromyces archimandritae]|uniref:FAD-dependent oxidoreductase n=1 Tax=Agromyces archimandritae TaxID=2781962 RepID=A0A975FN20_9MICO|nr:FAD-dependent oxidoreductase [Agromyces archimandritae]QTX04021.1 FAD-dependent oxidoreductase [Agromyces archimandritae]
MPHPNRSNRSARTVIVGGVAGGMSAATRLRRLDESREIVVVERSGAVSFANCGLPYHVSGDIAERDALELQTPERLAERFRIDARVRTEAVAVDAAAKTVTVRNLDDGRTEQLAYDELVLSPGAAPRRPAADPGAPLFALRTLDDLDRIIERLGQPGGTGPAVVAGGGYIGVEMADALHRRGIAVTLVQRGTSLLGLDPEMSAPVADHLAGVGIDLRLGRAVARVGTDHVLLDDGERLPAGLVIAAMGVVPETALAASAGLKLGPAGGILVDDRHRTSDPSIFAIGDAAEKAHAAGGSRLVTLAGLANRHGRQVADVIAGRRVHVAPALGTAIVDAAGLTVASLGLGETQARAEGRAVRIVHAHPLSHAGYFPGARPMSLKLVIDADDDRILGAQAVGTDGVDTRIDVIATAAGAGVTASGLADVELAYAPQYGSAKDPVNMLGYIAGNLADGEDRTVQWHELDGEIARGAVLLDVRAEGQLAEGTIPGAEWIPVERLRERHAEFAGRPVIVHCRVGQGAHTAARLLTELGHDVRNLDGGYLSWRDGRRATELAGEARRAA